MENRKPGWYFLVWREGNMRETQVSVGPFETVEEAKAEVIKAGREGYMTGQPKFTGPRLHAEKEAEVEAQ